MNIILFKPILFTSVFYSKQEVLGEALEVIPCFAINTTRNVKTFVGYKVYWFGSVLLLWTNQSTISTHCWVVQDLQAKREVCDRSNKS